MLEDPQKKGLLTYIDKSKLDTLQAFKVLGITV